MADAECQNGAQDEQSVGDWIEQLADLAHLIEFTRNETIEPIRGERQRQHDQSPYHAVLGDEPCDDRNGDDAQQTDDVWYGEHHVTRFRTVLLPAELLFEIHGRHIQATHIRVAWMAVTMMPRAPTSYN